MRPRSIVGPIVLIGIGSLFLVRNLLPEIAFFDMFIRYWPFLLIAWGVVRLVEVLFWAGTRRSVPAAGVSGGEWTLVTPVGKLSDSLALDYDLTLEDVAPGEHTIAVRVEDEYANQATDKVVVK